jgi:LmbE family N-acetylglucosaminyl deacetylase
MNPMSSFYAIVLLLVLAPLAIAQKSSHTMMAVFAHADDEGFIGPLLAHYAHQGVKIHLVFMTKGNSGRPGVHGVPKGPELTRIRADEAQCSCRELGIGPPVILDFEDETLGTEVRPPWRYIARAERDIRRLIAEIRPDVVITFGPDGAYGHPDHQLTGDVVSQVVQSGAEGAPRQLLYFGFPKGRLSSWHGEEPLSATDPSYLTVRVPYSKDDFIAFQKSFRCYKTQFQPEEMETLPKQFDAVLGGRIYLRPWFGAASGDDVFTLKSQ